MQKKIDIDIIIIFILPLIFTIFLLVTDNDVMLFGTSLTVSILFFELIIFKKRSIYGFSGLRIISLPSLIILTFTIFIAIPGVYIASIKAQPERYSYFISILAFYVLYPAGLLFGDIFKKINTANVEKIKSDVFSKSKYDIIGYEFLQILFSICVLIFLLYLLRTRVLPLFELIKNPGAYLKLQFMREEALKLLPVTFIEKYLFHWLRSLFLPFGIVASLFLCLIYHKRRYLILFILFFVFGIFINTLTLEKSPTAAIFFALMTLLYLRQKKIKLKFILLTIVIVLFAPILIMYFLHFGRENIFKVLYTSLLNRIFITPSETLFQYFKIFPEIHNFLYGRATQLFSWLHTVGQFPLANYVAKTWWKNPKTTGSANVTFIGDFWADFGWIGVLLSIFIVGIVIHLFYWKILQVSNYRKNIIFVTITATIVPIFTFGFFSSNFTTLFFTKGLILMVICLCLISSNIKFFHFKKKQK